MSRSPSPWEGSDAALDLIGDQLSAVAAPLKSLSESLASLTDAVAGFGAAAGALTTISTAMSLPADVTAIRDAWRDTDPGPSRVAASFAASADLLNDLAALTGTAAGIALVAAPLSPVHIALAATAATLALAGGIATVVGGVRKLTTKTDAAGAGTGSQSGSGTGSVRASFPAGRAGPNTLRGLQHTVEELIVALKKGRGNIEQLAIQELKPSRTQLDAALQGSSNPIHRQTSAAIDDAATALQRTAQSLGSAEVALQRYRGTL